MILCVLASSVGACAFVAHLLPAAAAAPQDGPGAAAAPQGGSAAARDGDPGQGFDAEDERHPDLDRLATDELRTRDAPTEKLETNPDHTLPWYLLEWGGGRKWLEDSGFRVEMLYTADASYALAGGADPDAAALHGLLDLTFTYETEPVLDWEGGTFHLGIEWGTGVNASERYGLAQPFSNIDAEERFQVSRVWYEQFVRATQTRVRVGKIDANSLFAYVENGAQFLHSSMGLSPTIYLMPTYPDPAFGAAVMQDVGSHGTLRAGVFDGSVARGVRTGLGDADTVFHSPNDLFCIAEGDVLWGGERRGRLAVGYWRHSGDLERFDGGVESGTGGGYLVLEQRFVDAASSENGGLDAFLQLGEADGAVSPFTSHLGAGLVWVDPTATGDDYLGLGVSRAGLSDQPGAGFTTATETAIELFYGFAPAPWMRVKPDLQYVMNPGGDATRDDAWIATLRATVSI